MPTTPSVKTTAVFTAALWILLAILSVSPLVSATPIVQRNAHDVYGDGIFSNADLEAAFQEASYEAMTGEIKIDGAGAHLARRSRESHHMRIKKRSELPPQPAKRSSPSQAAGHHGDLEKRLDYYGGFRVAMYLKNIAWTAGTSVFQGGCSLATRLFNLSDWASRGCHIAAGLTSFVSAFFLGGYTMPRSGGQLRALIENIPSVMEEVRDNFMPPPSLHDGGASVGARKRGMMSRAELAYILLSRVNDTELSSHAADAIGLKHAATGEALSYETWLTAAVQPMLVANDETNSTALFWLDFAEDHININNWVPMSYETIPVGTTAAENATIAADLEKRQCFSKANWCPWSGCTSGMSHTVCGSGQAPGK